ncbi:MAG: hypothetical protein L3J52_03575, partial [Proteobacteria bacterium]|nr:hypothetical protein [Pseudomonadota bacterium]
PNYLVEVCLRLTDVPEKSGLIYCFSGDTRANLHRVIKLGIQLVGLVARRTSRMLVPVLTFIIAFFALIKLNAILLAFLFPLTMVYVIILYFINRDAARNQIKLSRSAAICANKMGRLIDQTLDEKILSEKVNVQNLIEETSYLEFTAYRYKRRLAEVHVNWLNGGFLVLGSALLIIIFEWTGYDPNWMSLILFLVALKYAAGSLQQIASATVGFSRFLPETERVFRLLNANHCKQAEKLDGVYFYLSSDTTIKPFKLQVLSRHFLYDDLRFLDEIVGQNVQIQKTARVLLVSNKAKMFFNQVKLHRKIIKKIIVEYPEGQIHYNDVKIFLEKFNVEKFIQNQHNKSVEIDDI